MLSPSGNAVTSLLPAVSSAISSCCKRFWTAPGPVGPELDPVVDLLLPPPLEEEEEACDMIIEEKEVLAARFWREKKKI